MLTDDITKSINEFVYKQPRTIKEISELLKCSWLTADRYVSHISEKYGTVKTRVFRGGTKGALKIVYCTNHEAMGQSSAQQILLEKIRQAKRKQDFNPFDIFNLVSPDKRDVRIIRTEKPEEQELVKLLRETQKQLFIFSGNISFINQKENGIGLFGILLELAKKRVSIKILCRVDIASVKNIQNILGINKILGYNIVEIKHSEQPLRGFVVDDKMIRLRDEKKKQDYKEGELSCNTYILYDIYEREWTEWLEKVFWNIYSNSLPVETRLSDLEYLEELMISIR